MGKYKYKYIDYNEVLYQLEAAQIQRDWDLITAIIQSLQHFIALEQQQEMIEDYQSQINIDD